MSEAIKTSLAVRLKKLTERIPSIPENLPVVIETLGLQTPWLMEHAETTGILNVEDLKRHFLIAKQLVRQNSPIRASFLLTPLLFLSANSREDDMLKDVCEAIMEVLEHPLFTHENRDGFINVCWRFKWPDNDIQDDIFQFLGIGAPKLGRLLSEPEPIVPVDVLQRSLEYARKHLRSVRPRGAYQILLNALPLASWTGDENILESTLELAREFMAQSMNNKHIIDLFSKGCMQRLQKGRWQNSEIGLKCLAKIGIREVRHRVDGE